MYSRITQLIKRSPDASLAHVALLLRPRAEEAVQCTAAETCVSTEGSPFCYNIATGDFHDSDDTKGNLITGDYTLADGRRGNLYNGPKPTPTGSGAGTAGVTTAAGTTAATAAPTTAAATTGAAAAGAATAKPTANAASSNGNLGSALGGLLVVLGARLL